MKNAAWAVKKPELNRHSRLLLNARLADYDTFNEDVIQNRGGWLVGEICGIWPGPDADWGMASPTEPAAAPSSDQH